MRVFTLTISLWCCAVLSVLGQTQMNLPVTFNEAGVTYGVVGFGGAEESTIVADPTDPNNQVARVVKSNTAESWAGTTVTAVVDGVQTGFSSPIPFTPTATQISVRVWSPDANIPVRLKAEDFTASSRSVETEARTTVAGAWETLTFDFATPAAGTVAINPAFNYNKVSIFFNFGVTGAVAGTKTYYFDDLRFVASTGGGTPSNLPVIPLTFESTSLDYTFNNFGGGNATVINNPQSGGINTSARVGQMVKGGPEPYAGSFINLGAPIDFSTNKTFKVKVFMPRVGAKITIKVENIADTNINLEKEATGTVANSWEELSVDFSDINTAHQYQRLVLIFDLGTVGDGSPNFTYLFDDIMLTSATGGGADPNQMNLPVTFNEAGVTYGVVGFGGAEESTIVADPTDPNNQVARVVKSNTAESWAGTTVTAVAGGTQTGFSSPVPFTPTATKMNVRVWSPDANIPVRLKVEDFTDTNRAVETEARTTVAGAWETLTFDFAAPAAGTAAINPAFNYNKVSIFFNFGVTGAVSGAKTYYFDDIRFGEAIVTSTRTPNGHMVSFYPNPAASFIEVSGFQGQAAAVQIVDLTGRTIPTSFENSGQALRANVQHLPKGVYLLKIQDGKSTYSLKVLKN